LLGKTSGGGNGKEKEALLFEELKEMGYFDQSDVTYFKEYLEGGIVDTRGAIGAAKKEIQQLMKVLKHAELHYQWGEEDHKTTDDKVTLLISQFEKQGKMRLSKEFKELCDKKEKLEKKHAGLLEFMDQTGKNVKTDKKLGMRIAEYEKKIKEYDKKIGSIDERLQAIKTNKFYVGLRKYMDASHYNVFFRKAKKMHNDELMEVFSGFNAHVHSTSEKRLGVRWKGKIKNDETASLEIEPAALKIAGLEYLLVHNMNFRSDNVGLHSLKKAKEEIYFINKMKHLYGDIVENVPDILLTAHDAGGFRFSPEQKKTENLIRGEEAETPEPFLVVKLPTFQSIPKLQNLASKRIRNWHTKRIKEHIYASGAVLHTIRKDGYQKMGYIDVSSLIEIGEMSNQLDNYKELLKKSKDKERVREKINELKEKIKINCKKYEVSGDDEIGAVNYPGRPSNYQFIEGCQNYQLENGLPDVLVISEVLHGAIEQIGYNPGQIDYLLSPKQTENLLERLKAEGLPPGERIKRLEELLKLNNSARAIAFTDTEVEEFKYRVLPYVMSVLRNGGNVVIASGNHYNAAGPGRDEATILGTLIPEEYDNQVILIKGKGERFGLGTIRMPPGEGEFNSDGKTIYIAHKMPEGSDELIGAMKNSLKSNRAVDAVIYFDRHHGGGGFADGTAYALAFGKLPWNPYVDMISKTPSLHGIINFGIDETKKYFEWGLVLDPLIKKYMKK